MKRLLLAGAVAWTSTATLAGCYWLASYGDLTSGAGGADAGTDAPQADTGAEPDADATVVADAEAEAEAGPFCPPDAGPLVYCMDFDTGDAAALGLGQSQASAAVVPGFCVSPPNALKVDLYGQGAYGGYDYAFPLQPPRTVTLQFDVAAPTLGQWVTLCSIVLYESSTHTGRTLNTVISSDGQFQIQEYFSLEDGGNEQNGHNTPPLDGGAEAGAWHHVVMSITVDDQQQQYFDGLTVDGQVLEDAQPLALAWRQGDAHLGIGVTYGGGGGPRFYFDNVRADFGL